MEEQFCLMSAVRSLFFASSTLFLQLLHWSCPMDSNSPTDRASAADSNFWLSITRSLLSSSKRLLLLMNTYIRSLTLHSNKEAFSDTDNIDLCIIETH